VSDEAISHKLGIASGKDRSALATLAPARTLALAGSARECRCDITETYGKIFIMA
jgi:hypothetical protein